MFDTILGQAKASTFGKKSVPRNTVNFFPMNLHFFLFYTIFHYWNKQERSFLPA